MNYSSTSSDPRGGRERLDGEMVLASPFSESKLAHHNQMSAEPSTKKRKLDIDVLEPSKSTRTSEKAQLKSQVKQLRRELEEARMSERRAMLEVRPFLNDCQLSD